MGISELLWTSNCYKSPMISLWSLYAGCVWQSSREIHSSLGNKQPHVDLIKEFLYSEILDLELGTVAMWDFSLFSLGKGECLLCSEERETRYLVTRKVNYSQDSYCSEYPHFLLFWHTADL